MEAIDILAIIQQYVNLKAVVLAVALTQGIKYILPGPGASTVPGHWATRVLPFLPTFIGMAFCLLVEKDHYFDTENIIKGMMSGIFASYLYRTTKVSIFAA